MEHEYLDYDEDQCRNCIVTRGSGFALYLNRDALIEYRDSLYRMATRYNYGDEVTRWSDECIGFAGTRIGLFEIHLIREETKVEDWMQQGGPIRFQPEYDRLDAYLTRDEVKELYEAVGQATETQPAVLLGIFTITPLPSERFATEPS